MKILLFAPHFSLQNERNPESIVNRKLAIALLNAGWEVDIITRVVVEPGQVLSPTVWREPWSRLREHTYEIPYEAGKGRSAGGLMKLALNALRYGHIVGGMGIVEKEVALAELLHMKKYYDLVISRSNPDCAHLPAMIVAGKHGIPWIANWNDPAGIKLPAPYASKASVLDRFFTERFLKQVAVEADWHTFPSERLRRYVTSYLAGIEQDNSSVVPHVALPIPEPVMPNNPVFTLTHAGLLDVTTRNIETFLAGLSLFVRRQNIRGEVKLRLIGEMDDALQKMIARSTGAVVEATGLLPYDETLARLAESDALLVVEAPCREGIFLPSKFVDYVQTGRPILAVSPKEGTLCDILSSQGGGLVADCSSPESIAAALDSFYLHWKQKTLQEHYGSSRLYDMFSPATVVGAYTAILKTMGVLQ